MNSFFQLLTRRISTNKGKQHGYTKRELPKFKIYLRRQAIDFILLLLGMLSAGLGLEGFLLPNGFIDGGVTGVSLLISEVSGFSLPALIVLINIPFIYLGYKNISKIFAMKALVAIIGLSLCILFIPYPVITSDKLLVSVFGGFFLGAGIGLAVRGGGVIDGTEIMAISISRKMSLTIGDVILIINLFIFSAAALVLSFEQALYSILTYLAAAKTVDFIISGIEEHTGVTIISRHSDEIRKMLTEDLGNGVTIYQGKRGYGSLGHQPADIDIVFTVVTRLEISRLKAEVEKIDRNAFVLMHSINDTKGGMIKKRRLH
ncbi:MAG: YitT family protein [Bacteroidia bacterium]|nr:YitT family protein [Bacteroidia bacterium]